MVDKRKWTSLCEHFLSLYCVMFASDLEAEASYSQIQISGRNTLYLDGRDYKVTVRSIRHTRMDFMLILQYTMFMVGEGNGTPLQCSCLENPMDGGAWWAAVHGVAKSRIQLSDFTFTFHFPALEKEMATHSSVLAWRIPGTGEPGGLPSMESRRVGHDWNDLAAAAACSWYSRHGSAACAPLGDFSSATPLTC